MDETLKTALSAADALERLGVRWFIGGSLASSLLGIPRATLDADIIADLNPTHVKPLLKLLGGAWYADELALQEAIATRSSFNLIHFDTAIKVDVFIPKRRQFEAGQFSRTVLRQLDGRENGIPVCSPEDIIVAKLEWFRIGGELSERQWNDILGVLRINAANLNGDVMKESAAELQVVDLLEKAVHESDSGA